MAIIELSTALVAAGSGVVVPFVNKVLEKSAQHLGGHVDEHLAALFTRAYDYLAATGRAPQSIEAKIAIPLMQAAALESDPALIEKWAALLANSADPAQRMQVQSGFIDVLRQLTPDDAQVLTFIYKCGDDNISLGRYSQRTFSNVFGHFNWTQDRMELSLDNLLRQRLIGKLIGGFSSFSDPDPDGLIAATRLGLAFLAAVTPPTP